MVVVPTTALSLFQSVFNALPNKAAGVAVWAAYDVALAVKALIGSWTIARRNGDEQLQS